MLLEMPGPRRRNLALDIDEIFHRYQNPIVPIWRRLVGNQCVRRGSSVLSSGAGETGQQDD